MRRSGLILISVLLILALPAAGVYLVRKHIMEKEMLEALEKEDETAVRALLDRWPCPVNAVRRGEKRQHGGVASKPPVPYEDVDLSPLTWAITKKNVELAEICLEKGASVRSQDWRGATPLFYASGCNLGVSADIVKALLNHGANPNARAKYGLTPLHYAASPEVATVLMDHGADVMAKDMGGQTPLHYAAERPRDEKGKVAKVLLDRGADVNARDLRGQTPLYLAVEIGGPEITRLLIGRGADVNAKDLKGWTPLHEAVGYPAMPAVIEILIAASADVNAKTDDGMTLIARARLIMKSYPEGADSAQRVIDLLVKAGAKE